jgi:hypothetical protein
MCIPLNFLKVFLKYHSGVYLVCGLILIVIGLFYGNFNRVEVCKFNFYLKACKIVCWILIYCNWNSHYLHGNNWYMQYYIPGQK